MTAERGLTAPLAGSRILLAVGGGIAAYKSVELVRLLTKAQAEVQVVMSARATEFVGALTFQALSGRAVFTDLFSLTQESDIGHIHAADQAQLVIVAPATANGIARLAAGTANDAVSATVLATRAPVLLAPSMNVNMWEHPATRRNLTTLVDRGAHVVGPGDGFLACRWTGPGRLAEPADIVEAARRVLTPQDLAGRRVLVTAGPTRERIDPVRFLSNRSTGRMGIAVARAAVLRGAHVELVLGPADASAPLGVECTHVQTAAQMHTAVSQRAASADAIVMAAAVADYRPTDPAAQKLKKQSATKTVSLERTTDILATLGAIRAQPSPDGANDANEANEARPVLVGFAAETRDLEASAQAKLAAKGCDLIVANDVSQADAGFGVETNRVLLVSAEGVETVPLANKLAIAHAIWNRVVRLFDS